MRVFYWLGDSGGCGYYRCQLPADALRERGHDVTCSAVLPQHLRTGSGLDVLVGQRVCLPGASAVWQRLARDGHTKLVCEIDDDLWAVEPDNRSAAEFYTPDMLDRLTGNVRVADVVTVTTPALAERVSQWNRNVQVIPNQLPGWLLNHQRPTTDRVTIGWGGSASHTRDFGEVAKPLKRILQRHPQVGFHCMGPDFTGRVATPRTTGQVRHTGWVGSVPDYLRAIDFTVGIAPLRPSPFNDAKSELKLLELAALGIPAVVSGTGPYARAIADGAPAIPVDGHKTWERELDGLLRDPDQRAALAVKARDWAATRSVDQHIHLWEDAYRT